VVIYAGTKGMIDDIPVSDVRRFEQELIETMRARHAAILTDIRESGALKDDGPLRDAIEEFKTSFSPTEAAAASSSGAGQG
jgi:F-type H+/Na+-transporting ATPase subunit alpha